MLASATPAALRHPAVPEASAAGHTAYDREQTIYDKARAALDLGDTHKALDALREHAQKYPGGTYARLRERTWIESLVKLGRTTEACQRAENFRRAYPRSPLPPELDSLCLGRR